MEYLKDRVPHTVPRSACVFCPYKSNAEWRKLKEGDPESWRRAVEVDEAMRAEGSRCNEGVQKKMYVHRTCVPLPLIDFGRSKDAGGMVNECQGMCGV